jgi:hypothetical protein
VEVMARQGQQASKVMLAQQDRLDYLVQMVLLD